MQLAVYSLKFFNCTLNSEITEQWFIWIRATHDSAEIYDFMKFLQHAL